MNRRDVIRSLGFVSAHTLFPSILSGFISGCQTTSKEYESIFFTSEEWPIVKEMIEIILPATKTKSAAEVKVHWFLDEVFAKCLQPDQQALIHEGMDELKINISSNKHLLSILQEIDKKAYQGDESCAWFKPIKQYTLIGFFTSEEGATKANRYMKIPGDYQGDISIDQDAVSMANTSQRFYL